jgi:hypothetical protein
MLEQGKQPANLRNDDLLAKYKWWVNMSRRHLSPPRTAQRRLLTPGRSVSYIYYCVQVRRAAEDRHEGVRLGGR